MEWDGRALRLTQLDCLTEPDDIIRWADDAAGNDAVIGIDAPTVVPCVAPTFALTDASDGIGMRPADRLAHSLYGKYRAGPSPTNQSPAFWNHTTRLASALANLRFLHGDQLAPQSEGRHQIEVHPPAASVQLFLLARVIRYRRGTLAERKEGLRLLRGLMLDHFPRLIPKLDLTELPEIPASGPDLKTMEDRLDSLMSAYVAAHWWYWGRERNDVLGDAASGFIVVPHRRTADLKLADLREELKGRELLEKHAAPQPIAQFRMWLYEACCAGLAEPNAMTIATVGTDGQPSARVVSLSQVTNDGFAFYTNYRSSKGRELAENPRAALVFHWPEIGRQVRITGVVEKTARADAEAYFEMHPREAQLSAWASWQSSEIADREFLDARVAKLEQKYGEADIPAPASWGGYRLRPESLEFWQSRANHLHDRLQYLRHPDGRWVIDRLAP
ncbi:MAG TPA: pyridoxamine 5'-phosphate oxidase [Bryobacteraceae bacterium]|nr:pyridoxamine 5'-phosphate oxidase [Bryobacteraceae bacterium]